MLQRFPCSTVIFFVCISVLFECLFFPAVYCSFRSRPRGVYLRITRASFKGASDKVFKTIFRLPAKLRGNSCTTLAMLPDAQLRAYKPDRTGFGERIICAKTSQIPLLGVVL
jgi:hypothetical protein